MTGGASRVHSEPGLSLPVLDRLAPRPPDGPVSTWVERHTAPGDIVADPFGRGGWVARAALDHERRAVSLEIGPLQRMLAEIVLRPPDVRHLDAAVQGLATASHGRSSLKSWIEDLFATRCASCGRTLVVDAFTWVPGDEAGASARPISKRYRCGVCRDQQGGRESREAPLDADDLARAGSEIDHAAVRAGLLERFPPIDGAPSLPAELLDLHSPRQLAALAGILERIEGELRAAPVLAVLRLALLHAILPASRLATGHGRVATLRSVGGHVRHPAPGEWRERNPWLAYEEAFRTVRGFVQRLEGGATGPPPARLGEDLRSLGETVATAVLGLTAGAGSLLSAIGAAGGPNGAGAHVRLVIGQPPPRPTLDRIALAYHGTAWVLGREAAGLVPAEALAGSSLHPSWGRQADAVRAALERIEPATSPDARAVLLLDDGPEPLVAAALGATAAGYRLLSARIADPDGGPPGAIELVPPRARMPPGARTRANVPLASVPGGAGDPAAISGGGLFTRPDRGAHAPSRQEAARVVADVAVEVLLARGEPASYDRLLAEVLVGLDRAGQLAGFAAGPELERPDGEPPLDPVDDLIRLIHDELHRPTQRRLSEVEPGHWWLADPADLEVAEPPLSDRLEWAVFSLLSTAGPMTERAFHDRVAGLFDGPDRPDDGLIEACLESYRRKDSSPDRLATGDDLLHRSQEHSELIGLLADGGHRLGLSVWIGRREQARLVNGAVLGNRLSDREAGAGGLPSLSRAVELADVDCVWYQRGRLGFLFEVEWTAMLGEPLLRRHARIPPDERLVRFLVIPAERTELVRAKLARSVLLRTAMVQGNWHILKSDHLRAFLAVDGLDLDGLEPLLGLDPAVERNSEQLALFV